MRVGQWSSRVDCWLALFFLLRAVFLLRALEARCNICVLDWAGTVEKGRRVVLGVGGAQDGRGVKFPSPGVGREVFGRALLLRRVGWFVLGGVSSLLV